MVSEHPKTQLVRLADVAVVGPVMVLGAALLPSKHRLVAWPLGILGVLTVLYNARNYLIIRGGGWQ